jgi:hypothetical protein
MRRRTMALYAAAPLILSQCTQCEPACVPVDEQPAVTTTIEATTTVAPTTIAATTTTEAPGALPYAADITCRPLWATFANTGTRAIVLIGGFGSGPTPQTVIEPGASVDNLSWLSFSGPNYLPIPELDFEVRDADTGELINTEHVVLDDECPTGWSTPGSPVSSLGYGCDIGGVFSGETMYVQLVRSQPATGWTVRVDGTAYGTWDDAAFDSTEDIAIGWPADDDPNSLNPIWHERFVVDVLDSDGFAVFHDTYSKARLAEEASGCLVLFNN